MALKHGASLVYSCEQSPIMCRIARHVRTVNNIDEQKLKLIEKHSSQICVENDLNGKRVDLVVTELMDAGFFGEDIIGSLLGTYT